MCGPRILTGALWFGTGNALTVVAGVAGNAVLAVAFGAVFLAVFRLVSGFARRVADGLRRLSFKMR